MSIEIEIGIDKNREAVAIDLERLREGRLLVQGVSRSGKSWLLRRLLEQAWGHVQEIVIDLEGEYVSLAELYGHFVLDAAELERAGPRAAARAAREHRVSLVVDLSEATREAQAKLATRFLTGLVEVPEELWTSALVAVDEAHILAPQGASSGTPEHLRKAAVAALADLMARGSKRGLIGVVATQRITRISKSVVSEALNFAIGRTTLDLDVRRAGEVLGITAGQADLQLRRLKPGQFMVLGDAIAEVPTKIAVGPVESEHRGRSPELDPPPILDAEDAGDIFGALADGEDDAGEQDAEERPSRTKRADAWTDEEKAIIRAGYAEGLTRRQILERLPEPARRTLQGIGYIAGEMGLNKAAAVWSEEEIETMRRIIEDEGGDRMDVAKALGRPPGGVSSMMTKHGLHSRQPWRPAEYELLRTRHGEGVRLVDVARELGRPYANVAKIAEKMGLSFRAAAQQRRQANSNRPVRVPRNKLLELAREHHLVVETTSGTFLVDGKYSYTLDQLVALVNRDRAKSGAQPVDLPAFQGGSAPGSSAPAPEEDETEPVTSKPEWEGPRFEDDPRASAGSR